MIRIILYGAHFGPWLESVGPDAPLWKYVYNFGHVDFVPHVHSPLIPHAPLGIDRTVTIPLMEPHILGRPRHLPAMVPSDGAVRVLSNKKSFVQLLQENNLSHIAPENYSKVSDIKYPCVIKHPELNGSASVHIVNSLEDLLFRLAQPDLKDQSFLAQEFIPGEQEYTMHAIFKRGELLWSFNLKYDTTALTTYKKTGQYPNSTFVEPDLSHLLLICSLMQRISYNGPCNIDYKIRKDGRIAIFEINPRLGGSLFLPEYHQHLAIAFNLIIENAI